MPVYRLGRPLAKGLRASGERNCYIWGRFLLLVFFVDWNASTKPVWGDDFYGNDNDSTRYHQ